MSLKAKVLIAAVGLTVFTVLVPPQRGYEWVCATIAWGAILILTWAAFGRRAQ